MKRSEAISFFDGIPNLARALNISYEAVRQWPEDGVPELRQYQIEVLTNGRLKAEKVSAATRQADAA